MEIAEVSTPRRRRCAGLIATALAVASFGVGAPVAGAQDPGVIFEPGSPSYKEYSIPLEEARRDAGGGDPNGVDSRAFGIGLSRRGGKGDGDGGPRGDAGRKGSSRGTAKRSAQTGGSEQVDQRGLSERLADAEAAGAPAFWGLGVLLLVLLPGLLVGLLLYRRSGPGPDPAA